MITMIMMSCLNLTQTYFQSFNLINEKKVSHGMFNIRTDHRGWPFELSTFLWEQLDSSHWNPVLS
jgi:hypothetical protein